MQRKHPQPSAGTAGRRRRYEDHGKRTTTRVRWRSLMGRRLSCCSTKLTLGSERCHWENAVDKSHNTKPTTRAKVPEKPKECVSPVAGTRGWDVRVRHRLRQAQWYEASNGHGEHRSTLVDCSVDDSVGLWADCREGYDEHLNRLKRSTSDA